ncbi:HCP-like protein [Trichodelitschia bisporula]|uniref:HCP-like protein n=1 Tax=Trichodelitschia bisporula TaxID=703511 RepID=A0A6G1I6T1_9PEZI|nr:HCP-like protein [Trichodelitschia bisporula]
MSLLHRLRSKRKSSPERSPAASTSESAPEAPSFTFLRTTTQSVEEIAPPSFPGDPAPPPPPTSKAKEPKERWYRRGHRREDLGLGGEDSAAEWERRATALAGEAAAAEGMGRKRSVSVGSEGVDGDIQSAIRLHEEGDLERSTRLFGRLADQEDNALSQVLYGLALRHGWGIPQNESLAVTYLTRAAGNSAQIESQALAAGLKRGGAAKGELTLAMFELANCFRHGWGVKKDPPKAKTYYEVAANMGDTDGMNEVAWCYLEGFGCKKDKYRAAQYLRLAEQKGHKTLGNTWIWKDKYGGPMPQPPVKGEGRGAVA